MADYSVTAFKCLNPDCDKLIKIKRPAKSGVYTVDCPHCKHRAKIKFKGIEEFVGNEESTDSAPQAVPPTLPDNSTKDVVEKTDDFLTDKEYTFKCPHCQEFDIKLKSDKAGHGTLSCPRCKGRIGVNLRAQTVLVQQTTGIQTKRGKLVLLRKGWLNKDYHLHDGRNLIGRYDEYETADIAIKKDPTMSRRSVEIEVTNTHGNYQFKLTVLKCTNPVLHNNNPMLPGDSISLNFGDTIILGATKFRFDKED